MLYYNIMKIIIHSYSTIGSRNRNEDSMELINNLDGINININKILYAGIFDGHGGANISKSLVDNVYLSKYLCRTTSNMANKLNDTVNYNNKYIVPLFTRIQEKLKNYNISSNTMGSTVLISLLYPNKKNFLNLKVINLGDSRTILCNNYNIGQPLTLDHKPHLYCEKNRILQMGGDIHLTDDDDPRINGMSVSRAFGDLDNKYISQIPDIYDYKITHDKFIVMGCDGVWDVLGNQEVVDYVLEIYDNMIIQKKKIVDMKGKSDNNIAQKLAEYAIEKDSKDNISVYIIFFIDNI